MKKPSKPVSDAELDALKVLWAGSGATVREIHEQLAEEGRDWAYNTVLTLLQRLEEKGYAASRKRGRLSIYRARVSRERYLQLELTSLKSRVCDGATSPLMHALVDGQLSREDIRELRRRLREMSGE